MSASPWEDSAPGALAPDPAVLLVPRRPAWQGPLWLGLGYALLAGLSVALARQPGSVANVWYANALVVGVLAHRAPRLWPPALAAVALANLGVNMAWGDPLPVAAAFVPPNLVEILLAVALLRRAGLHLSGLRSPHLLLRLLVYGGLLPQLVGATLGAAVIAALSPAAYFTVWLAWFSGSVVGAVSLLPLVACALRYPADALRQQLLVPALAWLLPATLLLAWLALAQVPYPFVYLSFMLLVAALRLDVVALAAMVLLLSCTVALALALGVLVPTPQGAAWRSVWVYLAWAAALVPAQLLAVALAELRDRQARLVQRGSQLQHANEGLEQFVRIASHDMREPLNTIVQFTGLLQQDHGATLPAPAQAWLGLVARAGLRMRSLLDDMLQYARLQRDAAAPALQPVALDEVMAGVVQALQARLAASGGRLQVGPLPVVWGQAALLSVMLQNLVGNALKFMPAQRVPEVSVQARSEGGMAVIAVRDNGIGIAAADADKLFKPFSRLHLRREYDGTGLGLSLVRTLAQAQGGEVLLAESAPGEGSCFELRLPLAATAGPEGQRTRSPGTAPGQGSST